MRRILGHDRVVVRFIGLYALGLALFFTCWTLSYHLLPEGILRGVGILGRLAGESTADTATQEFTQIFSLNLIGWTLILACNYVLRVDYFSYGYLVPLAWMVMYAVTLGTNSFSIPMETRMAVSLSAFQRSGLWEMMAATLFAVTTDSISVNRSDSLRQASKPIPKKERLPFKREQWIAVIVSVLILALAAYREAYMIVNI